MSLKTTFLRAASAALLCALPLGNVPDARAESDCVSFGQARRAGWTSGLNLRSAGSVKKSVEARTGGKVVAFKICRDGPTYKLTVIQPDGNVMTVTEPAQ